MRDFLKKVVDFAKEHSIALGSVLVAGFVGAGVWAWGPSRTTFTVEKPATYVTFNSITNNPNIGDERDFVGIREKGTQKAWSNNVKVENGKEYYVRMYVHNNAASNLNLTAENVVAKMNIPTNTAKSITVDGLISASNAKPNQVWDNATFTSEADFNLAYVSGSALFENNAIGKGTGVKLPDSLVTNTGAQLGYDKLDGKIPGCLQYAGYVTVLVKAQVAETSNIDIAKTVRKIGGEKVWSETVNANSGDTVEFQIDAKNSGNSTINNLVIRDILPNGLEYIAGSAKLYNANNQFKGTSISDAVVTNTGANVGAYTAGSNAIVRLRAKVAENNKLPVCGENTLTNLAQASNQKIVKNDTASVKTSKKCETPKTPVYQCSALSITAISATSGTDATTGKVYGTQTFEFDTTYKIENTEFVGVNYIVKDSTGKIVSDKTVTSGSKLKFTVQSYKDEKYTVIATVITKNGNNTNANCEKTFETKAPEQPQPKLVCQSLTISKISRTKFEVATNITKINVVNNVIVKYEIKDSNGKVVKTFENDGSKISFEISVVGNYTIVATVISTGAKKSTCEKQFTVEEAPKPNTPAVKIEKTINGNESLTTKANTDFNWEIVVRNTGNVDLKDVKVTDKAPVNVKFISSDKGQISNGSFTYTIPTLKVGASEKIVIKSQATATNMKAKNVACVDTPTVPGNNDGCDGAEVEVPKDPTPETPENPVPPTTSNVPPMPAELPQTGIADTFGAILASGSLTATFVAYFVSRRKI